MIILEMADHGLDGGATAHLATDGFGDPADLAADPDLEPVRIVVTAIALVAMDAAHCGTCELFEIGDDGTERVAVIRISSESESAVKGITKRGNPEFQNARKPRPDPSFLAKSNTCSTQITATNQSLPNSSRTTL